jgi:hypothetical protein
MYRLKYIRRLDDNIETAAVVQAAMKFEGS